MIQNLLEGIQVEAAAEHFFLNVFNKRLIKSIQLLPVIPVNLAKKNPSSGFTGMTSDEPGA
jgi:hypothetical protein